MGWQQATLFDQIVDTNSSTVPRAWAPTTLPSHWTPAWPAHFSPPHSPSSSAVIGLIRELPCWEDGPDIVGFSAYHAGRFGVGRGLGLEMANWQALLHAPGLGWDPKKLLARCGLEVWGVRRSRRPPARGIRLLPMPRRRRPVHRPYGQLGRVAANQPRGAPDLDASRTRVSARATPAEAGRPRGAGRSGLAVRRSGGDRRRRQGTITSSDRSPRQHRPPWSARRSARTPRLRE
jgi:hypothetical protein